MKDRRDWLHAFAQIHIDNGDYDKAQSLLRESEKLKARSDTVRLAGVSLCALMAK